LYSLQTSQDWICYLKGYIIFLRLHGTIWAQLHFFDIFKCKILYRTQNCFLIILQRCVKMLTNQAIIIFSTKTESIFFST
jgi:hypothetical protein